MSHQKNEKAEGKGKEKAVAVIAEGMDPEELKRHFQNKWKDDARAKFVPESETIFSIARSIEPSLVASKPGSSKVKKWIINKTFLGKHVPYGSIQIGTSYGNPKIFPEGHYIRSGVGCKFGTCQSLNSRVLCSKDNILTILNLKENEVAIAVNETETQVCYGPSRYILLKPWGQAGDVVDLMQLNRSNYEFIYDRSIRALAFHVPKGEVALIQVNDDKESIRIFGSGHHVIAEGGARFVTFIDVRDTEMSRQINVRIKNGNTLGWPVTLSLQIVDPLAFHISKRATALDVIDETLVQAVAKFCANLDLNQIRGSGAGSESIYDSLAQVIMTNENTIDLAAKHGVVLKNVVIGTFVLDKQAEQLIAGSAQEELKLQNELRQNDLKMRTAEAKHTVDQQERELEKRRIAEKNEIELLRAQKAREVERIKVQEDAEIERLRQQKARELERIKIEEENQNKLMAAQKMSEIEEHKIRRKLAIEKMEKEEMAQADAEARMIQAQADADARMIQAKADVEAKRLEIAVMEETYRTLGKEFVQQRELLQIKSDATVRTFGNTEKIFVDPRFGAKWVANFHEDEKH
jgi:hypothetical protein